VKDSERVLPGADLGEYRDAISGPPTGVQLSRGAYRQPVYAQASLASESTIYASVPSNSPPAAFRQQRIAAGDDQM
jgi:hypothetical protein